MTEKPTKGSPSSEGAARDDRLWPSWYRTLTPRWYRDAKHGQLVVLVVILAALALGLVLGSLLT